MISIKLETKEGVLVYKGIIPAMNPPPDTILWGNTIRIFVRNDKKSERLYFFGDTDEIIYTEGLCYLVK